MIKRRFEILLIVVALFFGCNSSSSQNISEVIDVNEFELKMADNNVVVVDLRTDKEVAKGVIPGAVQMDFYAEGFKKKVEGLDKNKTYMVYCGSGGRSGKTAKLMADQGFVEVYDLKGGITAWKSEGKKIDQLK